MSSDLSRIQTHKVYVQLDNGREGVIKGRSTVGGTWGAVGEISFSAVAFSKEDAAIFLVNLRGKQVKVERSIDTKTGTILKQKFEETPMLTGMCYVLKLLIRMEAESGISQQQSNGEKAFRS